MVDNNSQEKIAEFHSLRQEIVSKQSNRVSILGFATAAVGAIFTAAMSISQTQNVFAEAGIFALIILAIAQILDIQSSVSTRIISGYIYTKLERENGLYWEHYLRKTRGNTNHLNSFFSSSSGAHSVYYVVLAICVLFFSYTRSADDLILQTILMLIVIFVNIPLGIGLLLRNIRANKPTINKLTEKDDTSQAKPKDSTIDNNEDNRQQNTSQTS